MSSWSLPIAGEIQADLVVVGGGPAGLIAAWAGALEGAKVLLVERAGFCGGNLTAGLVNPMMSFHSLSGEQLIRGLPQTFVQLLMEAGGSPGHLPDPVQFAGSVTPFEPEIWKRKADEILQAQSIQVLYHAHLLAAQAENGRIEKIAIATKEGVLQICGKIFIEATGDGDLGYLAGEETALGRESDGLTQPMSTVFRMVGVCWDETMAYIKHKPEEFYGPDIHAHLQSTPLIGLSGFTHHMARGLAAGQIPPFRDRVLFFGTGVPGEVMVNITRVLRRQSTKALDLSLAEMEGREQVEAYSFFLTSQIPGFSQARLVQSGSQIGIRETRRVLGEYLITSEDLIAGRVFEDAVVVAGYPIDIHSPDGKSMHFAQLDVDRYTVPFRALLAKRNENLLLAGRCASATHEAMAALRVSPTAMAMGEAVGRSAGMALNKRCLLRDIPVHSLQSKLELVGIND